ncbi:ChaN family lipoprotein [Algoriphagus sp.]|uniref:ChaN family lipoprotein n=1 Tax=Algoriphagus sp. TaxID=1872435 RepID=UPI00260DD9A8|nr:ChaN family lipoprotein [Algoriphagus sp.]
MRKFIGSVIGSIFLVFSSFSQGIPYQFFDGSGKKISFEKLISQAEKADVVFFGELHHTSLAHWLQLQVLKSLVEHHPDLVFASEFFERDDQLIIDEWMSGKITDKNFETEAKLWNNYATDYKPLMLFAKEHQIPFVAGNVPRRYASLVSRSGLSALDSLSESASAYFAKLPLEVDLNLPGYAAMKGMMHGAPGNSEYMIQAQALKDATMAESLFDYLRMDRKVFHVNGAYHSKEGEGILWYLKKEFPDKKIINIHTVEQEQLDRLEESHTSGGEFILVLPKDAHKSY